MQSCVCNLKFIKIKWKRGLRVLASRLIVVCLINRTIILTTRNQWFVWLKILGTQAKPIKMEKRKTEFIINTFFLFLIMLGSSYFLNLLDSLPSLRHKYSNAQTLVGNQSMKDTFEFWFWILRTVEKAMSFR